MGGEMRQTRRRFVGGAAVLGAGAMMPWPALAQTHPTRQSLATFSRDPARVASLRRGVAVMKARCQMRKSAELWPKCGHLFQKRCASTRATPGSRASASA